MDIMLFWISLDAFVGGIVLSTYFLPAKYHKYIAKLLFLVMTVISAFRYRIGADYDQYMNFFGFLSYDPDLIQPDHSFQIACEVLRNLGFDFQIIFVLYSLILMAFLYKGFKYYAKDYQQLVFMLALFELGTGGIAGYWFSFSMIRQCAAIGICVWATRFIFSRSLGKFVVSIVVASMLHLSAALFIVAYFLPKMVTKKTIFGVFLIALVVTFVLPLKAMFISLLSSSARFGMYVDMLNSDPPSLFSYISTVATYGFIFAFSKINTAKENFVFLLTTIGIVTKLVFAGWMGIDRIASMFIIFIYPMLVYTFSRFKAPVMGKLLMAFVIICVFSLVHLRMINSTPQSEVAKLHGGSHANIEYQMNFNLFK